MSILNINNKIIVILLAILLQGRAAASPTLTIAAKTKTPAHCVIYGGVQDHTCTPGAIFPSVTKAEVCTPGYASKTRNVPDSEKNQVYAEYGITSHTTEEYEIDHLISLELAGSNDIKNLWPEAAMPVPGAHEKDKVEDYLHTQVCKGSVSLKVAQTEIANNWLTIYYSITKK